MMIPFNEKSIRTNNLSKLECRVSLVIDLLFPLGDFLNELSNDGAKDQFATYLSEDIIPVMVHGARVS